MKYDLVVHGSLVLPETVADGWLGIENGKITCISSHELSGASVADFGDRIILPGAVDFHAHFSDPGRAHWESWSTGSRAAAAGGITTVADMPLNAIPATVDRNAFELKRRAAAGQSVIDFVLWGGLVDDNLEALPDLLTTGVMAIKAFMVDTKDDTFRFVGTDILRRGMEIIAPSGLVLGVHAEDNEGTWAATRAVQATGRKDPRAWTEARNPANELAAIKQALSLARETGCPLHIVHVSIPEGIDVLEAARASGQAVTWETCAHYLALTDEDFFRIGPEAKCAPPLRDQARQDALWDQLLAGRIPAVTSDHSPCPDADKLAGANDIWKAWGGISGIQCLLPVLLTEGVARRGMSWTLLAQVLAAGPARFAGLARHKGRLAEGYDADFSVVDPEACWTLTADDLHSRNRHSAYVGRTFQGRVGATYLRGRQVWSDGKFWGAPDGRFLPWSSRGEGA